MRDIDKIVSEGHIIKNRLSVLERGKVIKFKLLMGVAIGSLFFVSAIPGLQFVNGKIHSLATFDKNTIVELNGERYSYQLDFLRDYQKSNGGMTKAEFDTIVTEVREQITKHGVDPTKWEYNRAITITSVSKALSKSEEFNTGVIAIDKDDNSFFVLANMNGNLNIAKLSRTSCSSILSKDNDCVFVKSEKDLLKFKTK